MQITRGESLLWAQGREFRAWVKVTAEGLQPTHPLTSLSSLQNVHRGFTIKVWKHQGQRKRAGLLCRLQTPCPKCGRIQVPLAELADLSTFPLDSPDLAHLSPFSITGAFSFAPSHQTAREKWERWSHLSASHLCFGFA